MNDNAQLHQIAGTLGNFKNVLEAQIDAAITGLVQARANIATEISKERFNEVEHQLETVAFHLHDIQFNWLSLSSTGMGNSRQMQL